MINFDSNSVYKANSSFLTVVIITHNRFDFLGRLFETLNQSIIQAGASSIDVRVLVNGEDKNSILLLKNLELIEKYKNFDFNQIDKKLTPAEARNIVSKGIKSEWILFLDDDIEVPLDFFSNFCQLIAERPEASVWGGPNLTPQNSTLIEKKIGWLLENFLIVGPASNRYKINGLRSLKANEFLLSLCNLFIKTSLFQKIYFNPELKTAEENELFFKVIVDNQLLMSSPLLYVWHYRRKSFKLFFKQIRNYGFGRGQLIYSGQTFKTSKYLITLVPLLLVLLFLIQPIKVLQLFMIWMLLVVIQSGIKFKQQTSSFVFLSIQVWLNYSLGLMQGLWYSYKKLHFRIDK